MGFPKHTPAHSRNIPQRLLLFVLLTVMLLAVMAVLVFRKWHKSEEQAFLQELHTAHEVLSDQPDFTRMKAEGEWVRLYMADGTEAAITLPVDLLARSMLPWPHPFRLVGGWKVGDDVYFITGGAADDSWGYVLSGDGSVCMDGLHVLKRVGGNAWYFSTMAE